MSNLAASNSTSQYTDVDRRQAAVEYATYGNMVKVSEIVGIPDSTLYDWKKYDWWDELVGLIREQNKDQIESGYEQAIMKGIDGILDRIEHGDSYIDKDGQERRKAVSLRDLSTATGIAFDKVRLIRNQPTSIKATSTDARLTQLAEKVRELQGGITIVEGEVIKDSG